FRFPSVFPSLPVSLVTAFSHPFALSLPTSLSLFLSLSLSHTHTHTHTHTVIFLLREQDEINHSHISSKHLTFLLTPNSIWWLTDISYLCLASAEQAGVEFRNRKVPLFPILLV